MISTFKRLARRLRRIQAHRANNARIVAIAEDVEKQAVEPGYAPVVFFNASTRLSGLSLNAAFSLLSAWSVRLAGAPIIHFTCRSGLSPCVLGTNRENPYAASPCRECISQSQTLTAHSQVYWLTFQPNQPLEKALEDLSLEQLMIFEYLGIPLGELVLPSLRWILRRHHLNNDESTQFLYRRYILSAWNVTRGFENLIEQVKPQALVIFNGMFYPEAATRWTALRHGLHVISHEVGLKPLSAFFTTGDATAYPIDIPKSFELSAEQDKQLDAYLEQRFRGNFSMAGINFWPEMRSLGEEFWHKAGSFRQVVPVFTNVIFDTSQGHANVIFPQMFAWLDAVLEIIRKNPDTYFVIRAHPDETRSGKESRESVADWVNKVQADRLPNVLFVDSRQYFSSYELIQRSKFVMVYNSTIGLEASILGVPVLCGGRARYTQIPTVFFPDSVTEYGRMAEEFLKADHIENPVEYQRNARKFLYFQIFRTSLAFDAFIEDDEIWKGYVRLKPFSAVDLKPGHSTSMSTICEGILKEGNFLYQE